jgi:hypothetical protein
MKPQYESVFFHSKNAMEVKNFLLEIKGRVCRNHHHFYDSSKAELKKKIQRNRKTPLRGIKIRYSKQ